MTLQKDNTHISEFRNPYAGPGVGKLRPVGRLFLQIKFYWNTAVLSNSLATWCEEPTQLEKTLMLGKIQSRRRRGWQKGMTEGQMVKRHHWLNGHESEQTLGDREGKGRLMCCSPWGRKESDKNNNKATLSFTYHLRLFSHYKGRAEQLW